jgi:hypothetical protein
MLNNGKYHLVIRVEIDALDDVEARRIGREIKDHMDGSLADCQFDIKTTCKLQKIHPDKDPDGIQL